MTQQLLKEYLHYDPNTGIFTWVRANPHGGRARTGEIAGTLSDKGYIKIKLIGKLYRAHRLAWLYMTGSFPEKGIDHIDRNRNNNAFNNLREASQSENSMNRGMTSNRTNYKCVRFHPYTKKYQPRVKVNGKRISLGYYDTAEEAYEVYCNEVKKYHGDFACIR